MNALLRTLLSMAVSGSVLILLLLVLLPRLRRHTSRRWQYYIWLAAVLRLLLPFAPEASLMNRVFSQPMAVTRTAAPPAAGETWVEIHLPDSGTVTAAPVPESPGDAPEAVSPSGEQAPNGSPVREGSSDSRVLPGLADLIPYAAPAALLFWLGTALLLLLRRLIQYGRFVRTVRQQSSPAEDPALLPVLHRAARQAGVRQPVKLCRLPGLPTPMLLGVRKPFIALPDREIAGEELFCTLLHELIHLRRHDFFCRWLAGAAACLYWWNPLVRRLEQEMSHACELACDEAVLRQLSPGNRRFYGEVLLRAAAGSVAPGLPLSQGGVLLRDRLQAILAYRERQPVWPAALVTGIVAVLAVGLGACSLPLPEQSSSQPETEASQSESSSSAMEISPERAALMAQLPPMAPDSSGTYPVIPGDIYDQLVIESDQPAGDKPRPDQMAGFEENPLCMQMMARDFDRLENWSVLYESRDWVLSPREFDPEQMVFREQWMPSYTVILETSGDGDYDRLILSCQVSCFVTGSSGDYVPRVGLIRTSYAGREADLQLGEDLSGWQAVPAEGSDSHRNFWNPETGQGILISEFGCLPLSGLTEPPPLAFAIYARAKNGVSGSLQEDQLIMPKVSSGESWVMLWDSETHTLTGLEDIGPMPQLFWLEDGTLAVLCKERVCLYAESSAEPFAVIEAGEGLSEDAEEIFYSLAPLREGGGQYAIAYCTPTEWRFCVFDSAGEVLTDFGSGLTPDERYLADFVYTQGLLYFVYYPDGTGVSETRLHCCADARPGGYHTIQILD